MNTTILFISIAILVPSTITDFEKHLKFNHLSFHLSESKLKMCGALGMFTGNLNNTFKEWNYENKQSEVFLRLQNPSLDWLDYGSDLIWWKDESLFALWKWGKTLTVQCYFSLIVLNSFADWRRVFFQEQKCIVLLAEPKYVGQNMLDECDIKSSTFTYHL